MGFAAKLDDIGKPAWIVLVILGFALWWPIGLALLAFTIGSGRMNGMRSKFGRWQNLERAWGCGSKNGGRYASRMRPSGNRAFDEYREETLRRLEDEEREFREFLDRLRMAKDKAEFDQFMADRRRGNGNPGPIVEGQPS